MATKTPVSCIMGNVSPPIAAPTTIAPTAPTAVAIAVGGISAAVTVAGVTVARVIPVVVIIIPIGHGSGVSIRDRSGVAVGDGSAIAVAIGDGSGITGRPTATAAGTIAITPTTGEGGCGQQRNRGARYCERKLKHMSLSATWAATGTGAQLYRVQPAASIRVSLYAPALQKLTRAAMAP